MGNMDEENYGIVYALTNPAMPGLVKIGMTSKLEIDQRKNQLYFGSSGVPLPFECVYACKGLRENRESASYRFRSPPDQS